jgi:hypothetical protein
VSICQLSARRARAFFIDPSTRLARAAAATMIMLLPTMALFVAATAHAGPTKPHIVFFLGAPAVSCSELRTEDGRH